MTNSPLTPTLGAALLISNGTRGWNPPALLLANPLLLLRFREGVSQLFQTGKEDPIFETEELDPLVLLEEILGRIRSHLPPPGPGAGKPAFPLAMISATYEFGRRFSPHEKAFPHASRLDQDEFFAAVYLDAWHPDPQGETERIGYSGSIPAGWIKGAPMLDTGQHGHTPPPIVPILPHGASKSSIKPVISEPGHRRAVERIHEYLAAGDIYQANFAVPFRGRTTAPAVEIFEAGLALGGASFATSFQVPEGTILSFSPELLLRRRGDELETRPIKGTRSLTGSREGLQDREDTAKEALLSSKKDRAEHVMIVDLERNDLGRLCRFGSVTVDPFMEAVAHPTVMHLESTVRGNLRGAASIWDLFASIFPGGSVTGTPKKRALEIIGELEQSPRGIFCGALGWIDCEGDCELNLPIRTGLIRPDGEITFHAGGGIVADSDAAEEWREVTSKARFFLDAIARAEGALS